MAKNLLQRIFNRLEQDFANAEQIFFAADKMRLEKVNALHKILATTALARKYLVRYPQSPLLKRLNRIEILLYHLLSRHEAEKRTWDALASLLTRLRQKLAVEILEPRLYTRLRGALSQEKELEQLKLKEAGFTKLQGAGEFHGARAKIRLLLVESAGMHFAIPVTKIHGRFSSAKEAKLTAAGFFPLTLPATGNAGFKTVVAYEDLKRRKRYIRCNTVFTPVAIAPEVLRRNMAFLPVEESTGTRFWPQLRFYGRRFFLYGARVSYTIRSGGRKRSFEPRSFAPVDADFH
ncbi:MAG: hypothetical protein N2Z22_00670 [Turneriella sp.]|nr:hypothetical protein [Turneriella sp.]